MADIVISTSTIDVVAVIDQESFVQVFPFARPMRATIRQQSRTMQHPAENGVIISDHRIILQTEIEMPLVVNALDYSETFNQINNLFINGTLLSVQTRVGIYQNMIIEDLPHDESPDMYDAISIGLRFKEVIYFPAPSSFQPIDPANQSTVNSGQQQPSLAASTPVGYSDSWFTG